MHILGVGLSRTGTRSLATALSLLGYRTLHWASDRLKNVFEGRDQAPDFRRYDDVDAVLDIPAAYFWRELLDAYPDTKVILTWRDPATWYPSVAAHYGRIPDTEPALQTQVYGSTTPSPFLYKKKFTDHASSVIAAVPYKQLLVMNIFSGDGWDRLCPFLGKEIPDVPFPHKTDGDPLQLRGPGPRPGR